MRALFPLVAAVVVSLAVPPALASAQPKKAAAGPSAAAKERARAAYGRGQAAFNAGNYAESKTAFEEAFDAVPNPIVLLSIAESQAKLNEIAAAIATFQRYLSARVDAPDRADIEGKIKALSATPAKVAVTSSPAGADVDLDGFPTQKKTPAEIEVAPGEHTLELSLAGHHGASQTITAEPGGTHELSLSLEALPHLEPAPAVSDSETAQGEPIPTAPEPDSGRPTTAIWITGGVGVAGLVAGSVFGFLAMSEHSDFEKKPSEASADRGERLALFADVGFGVGVMALATAAVLYFATGDESEDVAKAARAPRAKLDVLPELSPSSVSATARVSF